MNSVLLNFTQQNDDFVIWPELKHLSLVDFYDSSDINCFVKKKKSWLVICRNLRIDYNFLLFIWIDIVGCFSIITYWDYASHEHYQNTSYFINLGLNPENIKILKNMVYKNVSSVVAKVLGLSNIYLATLKYLLYVYMIQ